MFLFRIFCISMLSILFPSTAFSHQVSPVELEKTGKILPLQKIIQIAKTQYPGRVLAAEFVQKKSDYVYELEILDAKGVVWEVKFNAASGVFIQKDNKEN